MEGGEGGSAMNAEEDWDENARGEPEKQKTRDTAQGRGRVASPE